MRVRAAHLERGGLETRLRADQRGEHRVLRLELHPAFAILSEIVGHPEAPADAGIHLRLVGQPVHRSDKVAAEHLLDRPRVDGLAVRIGQEQRPRLGWQRDQLEDGAAHPGSGFSGDSLGLRADVHIVRESVFETVAGLLGIPVCIPVPAEDPSEANLAVQFFFFDAPFHDEFVFALSRPTALVAQQRFRQSFDHHVEMRMRQHLAARRTVPQRKRVLHERPVDALGVGMREPVLHERRDRRRRRTPPRPRKPELLEYLSLVELVLVLADAEFVSHFRLWLLDRCVRAEGKRRKHHGRSVGQVDDRLIERRHLAAGLMQIPGGPA